MLDGGKTIVQDSVLNMYTVKFELDTIQGFRLLELHILMLLYFISATLGTTHSKNQTRHRTHEQ